MLLSGISAILFGGVLVVFVFVLIFVSRVIFILGPMPPTPYYR